MKLFTISLTSKSSLDVKNPPFFSYAEGADARSGQSPHRNTAPTDRRPIIAAAITRSHETANQAFRYAWFVQSQKHLLHINAEKIISVTLLF